MNRGDDQVAPGSTSSLPNNIIYPASSSNNNYDYDDNDYIDTYDDIRLDEEDGRGGGGGKENIDSNRFIPGKNTVFLNADKQSKLSSTSITSPSVGDNIKDDSFNDNNNPMRMEREPLLVGGNNNNDEYDEIQQRKRKSHNQTYRAWLLWMIDVLQRQRAPSCCLSVINNTAIMVDRLSGKKNHYHHHHHHNNGSPQRQHQHQHSQHHHHQQPVYIISGLEKVFIYGTHPVADAVLIMGIKPPRYLCYMVSGMMCDVIQFGIDYILHSKHTLNINDASICWFLSFFISVFFRHTTLRYLVFGNYIGGYYQSLKRIYSGYSIIIVLSTVFNYCMTHRINLPHYIAYIITLLWTGVVNYFILKKLWSFTGANSSSNSTSASNNNEGVVNSNSGSNNIDKSSIMNKIHLEKTSSDLSILSSTPSTTKPDLDLDDDLEF